MLKKFKGVICTLLVACALLCPVLSFAAPAYLPATAGSNTSDLVVITNPPSFSSTTQKGVVFCGYGKSDTTVTLYLFNTTSQRYEKMAVYGVPVSSTINASGVFWKKVNLPSGLNKILVYAENGNSVQVVRREVSVLNSSLADRIKDYTVNMTNALQMGR